MNALANINSTPITKSEQSAYISAAVDEILSGNIDPLQADLRLKALAEIIEKIRKDDRVKSAVIEEANKYEKTFSMHGVEITVSRKTTKDYAGLDPVLDDLYAQQETLKAQIKAREQTVGAGSDPATGEVFGPVKTTTSEFIVYKFK